MAGDLVEVARMAVIGELEKLRDQVHTFALALDDDRARKDEEILALERDIAGRLVQTPYVLLLSFPGINVVSAADFAGEMGPIEHYANAKSITGRAGLRPRLPGHAAGPASSRGRTRTPWRRNARSARRS